MAEVLLVSKPISPPWNDSGKNLVHDLARGLSRHRPTIMLRRGGAPDVPRARAAHVYGGRVGFAPAALDQARVLAYLCLARDHALWHFFFAPNPRSLRAGGYASRLRKKRTLHTLSSAPRDPRAVVPLLFADLNVVLSLHTERRLAEAGLAPERMRRIAPAIDPLALRSEHERTALRRQLGLPVSAPIVLFPGDLEFGEGAALMVEAARALRPDVHIVLACRVKTPGARAAADRLFTRVVDLGLISRVRFIGEAPRIHDLLACADVVALPSVDLYAKMDYPLVLLEAMSLARSVIVAEGSAAAELSHTGGAIALSANVESLAEGVQRLLEDDAARTRLGSAARDAVLAHYTYSQMASAYEQLYDELLA